MDKQNPRLPFTTDSHAEHCAELLAAIPEGASADGRAVATAIIFGAFVIAEELQEQLADKSGLAENVVDYVRDIAGVLESSQEESHE